MGVFVGFKPWRLALVPGQAARARHLAYIARFIVSVLAFAVLVPQTYALSLGSAAPLATARSNHTATQLTNGKLLVAGGQSAAPASTPLASAELYDPHANTWSAAAALPVARTDHTASLLDNGRVLIVGGRNNAASETALATAVLFDPTTNTWSNAGNLAAGRSQHTATRLRNGKILVVGGKNGATVLASAELYDPATNAWTSAASLTTARRLHTATAVSAGIGDDVIVIGGNDSGSGSLSFGLTSIERYSASTNSWFTFSATLDDPRYSHTASALPNGDIIIAGGLSAQVSGLSVAPISQSSAERFVFTTFAVSAAGTLRDARGRHSASLLPSGKILFAGGINDGASPTYLANLEVFDPVAGNSPPVTNLLAAHANHTATLLPTGAVLIVGGRINASAATAAAVIVRIAQESSEFALNSCGARFFAAVTQLADGRVLVSGGENANVAVASASIYDPNTRNCASVSPMPFARLQHTLTLLPTGKVLAIGGYATQGASTPRADVALYDPSAGAGGTWSAMPSLTVPRGGHVTRLLADGRVVVIGGALSPSPSRIEFFDERTSQWSFIEDPQLARIGHASVSLPDGKMLRIGGSSNTQCNGGLQTSDLIDLDNASSSLIPVVTRRCYPTATLLPNGKVLVVGGLSSTAEYLASAELFDPVSQSWSATPPLSEARYLHTATLLASGEVLVAGGGEPASRQTSEIYDPVSNTWRNGPALQAGRAIASAIALPGGRALLLGGSAAAAHTPEIVGPDFAPVAVLAPSVNAPTAALTSSAAITVSGTGFRPALAASGGDTAQSPSNAPVFELESLSNGQRRFIPQAPVTLFGSTPFTDTSFVSASSFAAGFPHGHAILRAWVNGVPSAGRVVLVATTPSAPSFVIASLASPTSANVSFVTPPASNGGAPITRYVFTSNPPGAGNTCNVPCSSAVISGLTPGTAYTFRVAAQNAQGIGAASAPSNPIVTPKRSSTTTAASSLNPSTFGQAVTFTASVLAADNAPINEAVGAVRFSLGGVTISGCGAVPVALASVSVIPVTYRASCTTSALNAPGGSIVAEFSGDAQTDLSNGSVAQTVNKAEQQITSARFALGGVTQTEITVPRRSQDPSVLANPGASNLPFVFTVAAASAGVCSLSPFVAFQISVTTLSRGICTVLIDQPGNANFNAAPQVNVSVPVLNLPTVALFGVPEVMYVGQSRRITVNVTGASPTGTVTITADTASAFDLSSCVAVPLTGSGNTRTASCVMRASAVAFGVEFVNASYSGDANHVPNGASVDEPLVSSPPSLNIDLSPAPGTANDAASDGVMILRYLAGFTGTAITNGAMGATATRQAADVPAYLASIRGALDVNGDGQLDLAIDGVLIVLYMRGLREVTGLFNGVAIGATMTTGQIENYLSLLMP